MAEPPMFQEDWVIQINKMLNNEDVKYPAILRVPTPLLDLKPTAYIPQFVSFGPYHHSKIEKDTKSSAGCKISRAEEYKGKTAAIVSKYLHQSGKNFKLIVEMMEQMRPDIEGFYQWPASTDCEYSKNFNLMMAIDSSSLLCWLLSQHLSSGADFSENVTGSGPFQECMSCDMLKLENQIPLFVLRNVFEHVKQAGMFRRWIGYSDPLMYTRRDDFTHFHFKELMYTRCDGLHPFSFLDADLFPNYYLVENEPHLMGCVHAFVSQFLQIGTSGDETGTSGDGNRSLLQKLKGISEDLLIHLVIKIFPDSQFSIEREFVETLTVDQLIRAGIKFKWIEESPHNIRFEVDSSTLYLPHIDVSEMWTEVFLRNMVALEFNDTTRPNCVTRYILLMASLVRSTDDVRLFKRRRIIGTDRVSDEYIANMWSDMCQPFFTGDLQGKGISEPLLEVLRQNYFRTRIKRMFLGFFDYVSSWKFIAPLAGFLGLVFTAIQVYPVLFNKGSNPS